MNSLCRRALKRNVKVSLKNSAVCIFGVLEETSGEGILVSLHQPANLDGVTQVIIPMSSVESLHWGIMLDEAYEEARKEEREPKDRPAIEDPEKFLHFFTGEFC
jgi:hypothetical protein